MLMATAKSKLFIGGVLSQKSSDFVAADFTTQVWKEITPLEALGTAGDTSDAITFDAIGEGRRKKLKGIRDAGTMEVVAGLDPVDEGQIAVVAAERTPYDYAFKVELNDEPPGGTPSSRLFIAQVMSAAEAYDTANNVVKFNMSLAINSNIVRVDAVEA
ncbi:hypothetical protein [Neorhizobium sp. T25_13]|uniref:hypothetical protein n=1 Tax=Neorhizobium sp. T25_13 TaxID=2093830 RepID=UPI000CF8CE67|nr:hypothetical protein [Neorhizobium sp. T25_13]